jgi:hypothetical protein
MNSHAKESAALYGLMIGFLGLAGTFLATPWGKYVPPPPNAPAPADSTNMAPIRAAAARAHGLSGAAPRLACRNCHSAERPPTVEMDSEGVIRLPDVHRHIAINHGKKGRNDHCFHCHDPKNLEQLRVRDSEPFKFTESSKLCGSCHGPTLRDWEKGAHGRMTGFWDTKQGKATRTDCTSCHDPHSPAFPPIKPGPRPNPLHPTSPTPHTAATESH